MPIKNREKIAVFVCQKMFKLQSHTHPKSAAGRKTAFSFSQNSSKLAKNTFGVTNAKNLILEIAK